MSEVMDAPGEECEFWFHNPESFLAAAPLHPYNDKLIQFTVLKGLGYPVDLQTLSAADFPQEWRDEPTQAWELANSPTWVRPIADRDFEKFIGTTEAPGDMLYVSDEVYEQLEDHPMRLVYHVYCSSPHDLAAMLNQWWENEEVRYVQADHNPGLLSTNLFEQCFMAAFEIFTDRMARAYPFHVFSHLMAEASDIETYKMLRMFGQKPINPEWLCAIMADYYGLVESIIPEFRDFKGKPLGC